nr:protein MOR1 isoform X2 [Ipomoea batatas]GMC90770.1 protein MOR1 isoform X2 [Ipomoea batatas]GMD71059.1 protein MOR1 isoform X2 [Ipomoea batatas]
MRTMLNLLMKKATKWSEWKEVVAKLTKLASTRKIAPGDFAKNLQDIEGL